MKSTGKTDKQEVFGRVQRSFPRLQRILVPLDFSGKSRQALQYAAPIAGKFAARVLLLHVLPEKTAAARKTAALKRLRETGLRLMPAAMLEDPVVRTGKPGAEILAAARQHNADLIALTTSGQTGLKRLLAGSTAEEVVRLAPCPVLTVRKK